MTVEFSCAPLELMRIGFWLIWHGIRQRKSVQMKFKSVPQFKYPESESAQ